MTNRNWSPVIGRCETRRAGTGILTAPDILSLKAGVESDPAAPGDLACWFVDRSRVTELRLNGQDVRNIVVIDCRLAQRLPAAVVAIVAPPVRAEPDVGQPEPDYRRPVVSLVPPEPDGGRVPGDVDLPADFALDIPAEWRDRDKEWTFTNYSNGTVFHGLVDELLTYDRALTADELKALPLKK